MGNVLHFYFFLWFWKFEYSRMLAYPPIFCICCRNPQNVLGILIPHFPMGPKMKAINIKKETCQTKDPVKRWKKIKLHPLELFTCKDTQIQGVKTIRNSKQITKNLLYVILMNLEFFSTIFYQKFWEKKLFLNINSLFCNYLYKIIMFSLPPEFFSFIL